MPVKLTPLPPADAIAAFLQRGGRLDPSFHWTERWQDEHARAFTVAKSAGFDVLTDIHSALRRALEEGWTPERFADELRPILQEKGWWGRRMVIDPQTGKLVSAQLGNPRRLQIIFDANMRASYAAGQWAGFERRKAARPFLRYVHLQGQEHPRLVHEGWHNIVLPVDHPWWDTHATPNGWFCHCTIQSLSQRDIERLLSEGEKLRFDAPPIETRPWTNSRTGETIEVPVGIDPGWAHNPGKAGYLASQGQSFAWKIAAAPAELAEAAIAERVASRDFANFVANPAGDMPVFLLPYLAAEAIGAQSRVGLLSAETMRKQLLRHPELTIDDYRKLPEYASRPDLIVQDGDRTLVLLRDDRGRWHHAAVKVTTSGKAIFLSSYRLSRESAVLRLLAQAGVRILFDGR